jgi:hypothetical protein
VIAAATPRSDREEGTMIDRTISRRIELAHRSSGGIDVYLFWDEPTGRVSVGVLDVRDDESFEFEVDGRHALDAFDHPYAYAARRDGADLRALSAGAAAPDPGGDTREATTNPRRINHARTDR